MKSVGVVRKIDALGRVVLPIEIRRNLNLANEDCVEIFVNGDTVVLQRWNPTCVFCGSMENTKVYKEKVICENCLKEINAGKFDDNE